MEHESYAIWWVPLPGSGLAEFGAEWTGWCADRGVVSSGSAAATQGTAPGEVPGGWGAQGHPCIPEGRKGSAQQR